MNANRSAPPIGSLLAAILLAELMTAKRGPTIRLGQLSPGQEDLLAGKKCSDLSCDVCHPAAADTQRAATGAGEDTTKAEEAQGARVNGAIEISPDIAELVGISTPGFDPDSLEGNTRLLAAAFITNVRKLGDKAVNSFPAAGAKLSGIRFVENTILSALHTFTTLAKKS
ncbi:hypothetical protein KW843_22935 [Acidovorax sp. sif1233]|uniref:hypothetical protein n=1 Tax=Acidovorax sp. sif1233 TaxID=2854792 RepID=UPI001C43D0CE|nr:hypothetical protein [Acidovorax sp. sif1233]MBV7457354.1 hypothetical protein [Acidovorax sp. sif1233]